MTPLRTVVYDREVHQDIDAAAKLFRRLDDSIRALEWRLSHSPKDGVHRKGRYWVYHQKGIDSLNIPEITLLYSFTDDQVEFHAITIRPAQ
ncbi:MAG: hypothetical protein ACYCSN_02575 [Acidobacteriaceae bacterium]